MLKDLFTLKFLDGRRTLIAAIAIGVLTFLLHANFVTQEQYAQAVGVLTSIGLLAAANHKT